MSKSTMNVTGLGGVLVDIWRPPTEMCMLTFDMGFYQLYNTDNTPPPPPPMDPHHANYL